MTVTLTPDTEMRLRAYAEKLALDPEQLSNALLTATWKKPKPSFKPRWRAWTRVSRITTPDGGSLPRR